MDDAIDDINLRAMSSSVAIKWYAGLGQLAAYEKVALDQIASEVRGQAILDMGVGGGRTVLALRELSPDYLGIDYSKAMVDTCRERFPGLRFEHMDARKMSSIENASIALAVFSCNGISMVGHDDRLAILREVHRVLKPNGIFLFTTYNRNSPEATAGFQFPTFKASRNPVQMLKRAARWTSDTVIRIKHRRKFVRHEQRTADYALINDHCHNYAVMLYYISLAKQRQQLEESGFAPDAQAFDQHGHVAAEDSRLNSILLLARKR